MAFMCEAVKFMYTCSYVKWKTFLNVTMFSTYC